MLQNLTSNITRPAVNGSAVSVSEECYKELKEEIDEANARIDALSDNVVTECIQADRGNITTLNSDSIETDNIVTDGLSSNSAIVTNASIDHITNKDITTECVTTGTVTSDTATVCTANIDTATINHLSLTSATIPTLSSTNVTTSNVTSTNVDTDTITADSVTSNTVTSNTATIASLNSTNITASTVTAPVVNTTQINAQNVTATNKVTANSIDAVTATLQDIENTGIKANGTINLDPELPSTNDYYQLFIPEFDNFYATFYGKSNDRKLAISIIGTKKTAIVQASQDILGLITDVEFKRNGGIYIKFKADEQLHYHIVYNSENYDKNSIAVTLNGTNTAEYSYAVDKAGFYIFRGYNSNDISAIIPVNASIHAIEADEQHYQESTTEVLKVYDKLYVVDTVDSSGTAITLTSGEDNQYLSVFDTGAVDSDGCAILHPTYKTPVDTITGCLSNSQCLITERAVSTWNGTTNAGYPISHLNEATCAHGDLNVVCGVTSDSVTTNTATVGNATITCADITDSTIGNAAITCADITEETVTSSDIDTATITDATITDATITNAAIDELSANTLTVSCDVKIAGDLYVDGTTHTVNQEDIEVEGDTLALRVNNSTSLAAGQVSGIMINKYNGTDNLTIAADCTGTARVGTGTGTDTSYTNIAYDDTTHKWYDYDGTTYTEMATQPTGTITSYTDKVVDAPYTRYAIITFTAIDITSLEPILTRAEEADMEDGYLTRWDATNKRTVTCGTSCTHDLCVNCNATVCGSLRADAATVGSIGVTQLANVFGDAIITGRTTTSSACVSSCLTAGNLLVCNNTTLTGTTCACDDVTLECDLTVKEDIINCGSTEICGDLTVHGDITIGGDISLDKIGTVTNADNCAQYLTFVADNNTAMASEQVRTDADITYNPYTDTMTVPTICATQVNALVCGNLCGLATNATCFNGCTYACAKADIRSGLTGCTGTVTVSNSTSSSAVPLALCTGATAIGRSTCCGLTYVPTTGVLTATKFCGALSGTATNATCFNGCTYAQAYANIRSGLTSCTGTVTSISVYCGNTCKCSITTSGSICLGSNAFNSTAFTTCTGTVTSVNVSVNGTSGTAVTTSGTVTLTGVKGAGTCVYNAYCLDSLCGNNYFPLVFSRSSPTTIVGYTASLAVIPSGITGLTPISYNPVYGELKATTFCGALSGTATNANNIKRTPWSNAYDFDVSLTAGITAACDVWYVSCSCRLRYCNTTGALRITNSSGTVAGSVSATNFCGSLCGLAACTSSVKVAGCTEADAFIIPFMTVTNGYGCILCDGSLRYDPDEQCFGANCINTTYIRSNYVCASCMLCAQIRCAHDYICQYGSSTANSAFLRQCDTTACTTELVISFSCTTLQNNLFNAIICNVNLCRAAGANYTPAQAFFGLCNSAFIRWDSTESPRNIDFVSAPGTVLFTIYAGCACTINREGAVKIFGKKGTTTLA